MKSFLKNYFSFNKRDKNAFIILLVILIIIIVIPFINKVLHEDETYDFTAFRSEILSFELAQRQMFKEDSMKKVLSKEKFNFLHIDKSVEKAQLNPFRFNPNNLSIEEWLRMGLTERQINGIKNFEAKGGRFYIKSDFKKLYVISESEYEVLEPYIDLPDNYEKKVAKKTYADTVKIVELNSADSLTLKSLKGIGNVLSKRIVWYREKLGGYYCKEQLLEVNGIDTVLFKSIEPYLSVEKRLVKQMDVNIAEFDDLRKHPYISSNVALSIVNYRRMHGLYQSLADIMKSELIDDELFYRISPYLECK